MSTISVNLPDDLLKRCTRYAQSLRVLSCRLTFGDPCVAHEPGNRTATPSRAPDAAASHKVRGESLRVNAEFDAIEMDPDA